MNSDQWHHTSILWVINVLLSAFSLLMYIMLLKMNAACPENLVVSEYVSIYLSVFQPYVNHMSYSLSFYIIKFVVALSTEYTELAI